VLHKSPGDIALRPMRVVAASPSSLFEESPRVARTGRPWRASTWTRRHPETLAERASQHVLAILTTVRNVTNVRHVEVRPATAETFEDVATILAPKKHDAPVCWCLSYRVPNAEYKTLSGRDRPDRLRDFCERDPSPGVVAYVDEAPAGWCSFGPRSSLPRLANSRTIPKIDDLPVWSVFCFVIRPAFRRMGLSGRLLEGVIDYAGARHVPVLEAYPFDAEAQRISASLAYVGTTRVFEAAGFSRVQGTSSKTGGLTRWLMRLEL
jgi:GNAT superfamily N-acetyltransferase